MIHRFLLALFCLAFTTQGLSAADFYLAPNGQDDNPGTIERPLATLAEARNRVRQLQAQHPGRSIEVLARGGVYRLEQTVIFGLEDSATTGARVTYGAYANEIPIFSAGQPIRNWRRVEQLPKAFPEIVRGKLWEASIPDILAQKESVYTLYDGERRLPRARGNGFEPTKDLTWSDGNQTLHFPPGALKNWTNLGDAELLVIPMFQWVLNYLPIQSVDEQNRVARTAVPCTYPMGPNQLLSPLAWIENVPEVLDQPGEWVLDRQARKVYFWPIDSTPGDQIVAPLLTELIRIEGAIDYDGPTDTPVRGLSFRGLTFTHGDRHPFHGRSGWGLQHDWEMFDQPTALVRLRGAEDCAFEDCRFVNSGHTGLRLDLHAQNNRIIGNEFAHLGGGGVLLAGYGPGTKNVNRRNELLNNHLHHLAELIWHVPAVFVWQSGENRIAHNEIHHVNYDGIVISTRASLDPSGQTECSRTMRVDELRGRWKGSWAEREPFLHGRNNLVEYNDIHNCVEALGDGSGIYISGTGSGNIVRRNYVHDFRRPVDMEGIRCDDDQEQTLIEENIIYGIGGLATGISLKGRNDIINNIIACPFNEVTERGMISLETGDTRGSRVQRNILYASAPGQSPVLEGMSAEYEDKTKFRDCDAQANIYFNFADPDWGKRHLRREQAWGNEKSSLSLDPQFEDLSWRDFRLKPSSPARALGIESLDATHTGPLEPYRTRFFGRKIQTRILPQRAVLTQPLKIKLECSDPSAVIRYTMDGSKPTAQSVRYRKPIMVREETTIRAKGFLAGASDTSGAIAHFAAAQPEINQDFETLDFAQKIPYAKIWSNNTSQTLTISKRPDGAGHCLQFSDEPSERPWEPMLVYSVAHGSGLVKCSFDLQLTEQACFSHEWRQGRPVRCGPSLVVRPGGRLLCSNQEVALLPLQQWLHFEVTCGVGPDNTGTYDVRVSQADGRKIFCRSGIRHAETFVTLDWLGFAAEGNNRSSFALDNIVIREFR